MELSSVGRSDRRFGNEEQVPDPMSMCTAQYDDIQIVDTVINRPTNPFSFNFDGIPYDRFIKLGPSCSPIRHLDKYGYYPPCPGDDGTLAWSNHAPNLRVLPRMSPGFHSRELIICNNPVREGHPLSWLRYNFRLILGVSCEAFSELQRKLGRSLRASDEIVQAQEYFIHTGIDILSKHKAFKNVRQEFLRKHNCNLVTEVVFGYAEKLGEYKRVPWHQKSCPQ